MKKAFTAIYLIKEDNKEVTVTMIGKTAIQIRRRLYRNAKFQNVKIKVKSIK